MADLGGQYCTEDKETCVEIESGEGADNTSSLDQHLEELPSS